MLQGFVELKELSFATSHKGARNLEEPRPRGYGEPGRGWQWYQLDHDRVVVARSRDGAVFSVTIGQNFTTSRRVRLLLLPRLAGPCVCIGRAPRAGPFGVLRSAGHTYETVHATRPPSSLEQNHLMNIDAYARRLVMWIQRFRGVASRYRDNYLMWHRMVDPDASLFWTQAVILASIGLRACPGASNRETG